MTKVESREKLANDIINMRAANFCNKHTAEIKDMEKLLFKYPDDGKSTSDLIANALRMEFGLYTPSDADAKIFNALKEGTGSSGGYIVPDDILSEVREIRKNGLNLEQYVNVEPVSANSGRRTFESRASVNALEVVGEGENIPETDPNDLIGVNFLITKRAGICNASAEIFEDTNESLMNWMKNWASKKSRATRNTAIIAATNAITATVTIPVATVPALRTSISSGLDDVYKFNAIAMMNYTGYELLDAYLDITGKKANLIQSDPADSKYKLLYGLYPIVIVPAAMLPNGTTNTPVIVGDFMEAITLFDRERADINVARMTTPLGVDVASFKLRERIDVKGVDTLAIIKLLLATG